MSETNNLGKILLVDDEQNITELLTNNLVSEGFIVDTVPMASDVNIGDLGQYRLLIVDAMTQPKTGIDLSREIKANESSASLPIIVCTSLDGEEVIINAFDSGAEDFVAKPFSLREMMARIRAILRRHPMQVVGSGSKKELHFPDLKLSIETDNQKVTSDGVVVPLTKTEYAILLFLITHRNSFFTRMDICNEVWKDEPQSNERIVDTNISRLRKKLGDTSKYIINRYGMGYAFVDKIK